ncbi:MAG: hypothetical protein RR423_08960 [Hydrogenoanaerobacterium sp.]
MKLTKEQFGKLHELAFAGASNKSIAEQMGLPITEVYALRSSFGITRNKVATLKALAEMEGKENG